MSNSNTPRERNKGTQPKSTNFDIPAIAAKFDLKPQTANGKTEYHGANPFDSGATKNGFILYPEGNAFDRSTGAKYRRGEVAELSGLSAPRPNSPSTSATSKAPRPRLDWEAATTFDYHDENGDLLFQVGRTSTGAQKIVSQRRPSSTGGWIYNLQETRRVLYRLPDVLGADVVFLCEGEKAADAINTRLEAMGLFGEYVATTTSGGAGNAHKTDFAQHLESKRVGVLPDNDEPGAMHAEGYLKAAFERAEEVKRVELPELPPKGDADDYFEAGGEIEGFLALFEAAPKWEAPRPEPRFKLLSYPQLLEIPDPEFLIDQWLIQQSTILFTAKEESFKSFLALDMALCVAIGKPWHGFRIKRPGTVVYIAAEGASGIKKRVQGYLAHHGETLAADRFFVLDMPLQFANDADRRAFIEEIKALNPSLIVFDTLRRCAVGLEENSASDMGKISDGMGEISRETGAAVMVIHHNNKTGAYSGSTALPGNVDTHLSCERKDDIVTLKLEKQKDFEKHKPILFEAQPVSIPSSRGEATSLVMSRLETRSAGNYAMSDIAQKTFDALVEVFQDAHVSSSKWMKAAEEQKGIASSTFYKAQTELLGKKIVEMVSGEKNGRGKNAPLYAVSPDWLPPENPLTPQLYENSQLLQVEKLLTPQLYENSAATSSSPSTLETLTPQLYENSTEVVELRTSQLTPQLHTPLGGGVMELELESEKEGESE